MTQYQAKEEEMKRSREDMKEEEQEEEDVFTYMGGPPPPPPLPNINFAQYILDRVKNYGETPAMVEVLEGGGLGMKITYNNLLHDVPAVAGGLVRGGVGVGDMVGVCAPHSLHIDFAVAALAVVWAGGVCVFLNSSLNKDEMTRALGISEVQWVLGNVGEAGKGLKGSWWLERSLPSSTPCLGHLLQSSPVPPRHVDAPRTPAAIFFSSGTTGLPKAVLLSHTSLLTPQFTFRYLMSLGGVEAEEFVKERFRHCLLPLPLHHMYGFTALISFFLLGGSVFLLKHFSLRSFLQAIQDYKISASPVTPHVADYLSKSHLVRDYDISSLQSLSSASAPLSLTAKDVLNEKLGIIIGNGYGLTEFVNITSNSSFPRPECPDSVGTILPYTKVKIMKPRQEEGEDGRRVEGGGGGLGGGEGKGLGVGELGEVCVKGPTAMMGYLNDPQSTAEMMDPAGWLHTGDMGYMDEHGCLHLSGRCKELIKVKGFQVAPRELEEVLLGLEGVMEAAVVGVPHPRMGEAPRAFVVLGTNGQHLTPSLLKRAVAERLSAPYKQLVGGVEVLAALPRNASGKVLKNLLRQNYLSSRSKL